MLITCWITLFLNKRELCLSASILKVQKQERTDQNEELCRQRKGEASKKRAYKRQAGAQSVADATGLSNELRKSSKPSWDDYPLVTGTSISGPRQYFLSLHWTMHLATPNWHAYHEATMCLS